MGDTLIIREFLDGKAARETQNFRGPCEPGFSRAEWVQWAEGAEWVEPISVGD